MNGPPIKTIIRYIKMYYPLCCIAGGVMNIITCYMYNNYTFVYSGIFYIIFGIITAILFHNEMAEVIFLSDHKSLFEV